MFRNLFVVHFRYGENALVRAQALRHHGGVVALSPLRGGRAEARNVIRAIRGARACDGRGGGRAESGRAAAPW